MINQFSLEIDTDISSSWFFSIQIQISPFYWEFLILKQHHYLFYHSSHINSFLPNIFIDLWSPSWMNSVTIIPLQQRDRSFETELLHRHTSYCVICGEKGYIYTITLWIFPIERSFNVMENVWDHFIFSVSIWLYILYPSLYL